MKIAHHKVSYLVQPSRVITTTSADNDRIVAQAIIRGIQEELPGAAYFTREDILHLQCFSAYATITRYQYVCSAVRFCINRKWMYSISRTDLVLPGGITAANKILSQVGEYSGTVEKLVADGRRLFSVDGILQLWTGDVYLTLGTKRTIIRRELKRMLRDGMIEGAGFNIYRGPGGQS